MGTDIPQNNSYSHEAPELDMTIKPSWNRWAFLGSRFSAFAVMCAFCLNTSVTAQQVPPEMPMQARHEDGAEFRWLNKKVLESARSTAWRTFRLVVCRRRRNDADQRSR
jgi:hypothetical protein